VLTRALRVRARVEAGEEPRFDRLRDPLATAIARKEPLARERYGTLWGDDAALTALAEAKKTPLDPALARELRTYHERLGAPAASLASLERLTRGEAVAAVAGQQPAPLTGPLYSLHKTAGTVGLARRVTERTGVVCVPLFWTHAEDSDFAEIRGVTAADPALNLADFELAPALHHEGELVGGIAATPVQELVTRVLETWRGLPGHAEAVALAGSAAKRARDLGELQSALVLALFGELGVVVVDPRLPGFRAAARPVLDRYLASAEGLSSAALRAGERLEREIGRRPLADASLDSFVFAIEDGVRRKVSVSEARGLPVLSPSVALRPAVQDGVLPTVAMACGPGELAYLAQLTEVFAGVGVRAAAPVPRFGATWLAPPAVTLLDAAAADPWDVVVASDALLKRLAETRVPRELAAALESVRADGMAGLERVSELSKSLDTSLPQMVESARAKVDFQFARLLEGTVGKARHRLEREHPEWVRVRYHLSPGDRLQERRLSSFEPVAYRGAAVAAEIASLAEDHAAALEDGHTTHLVLEL
jgi:bacillithiol synthase